LPALEAGRPTEAVALIASWERWVRMVEDHDCGDSEPRCPSTGGQMMRQRCGKRPRPLEGGTGRRRAVQAAVYVLDHQEVIKATRWVATLPGEQ